MMKLFVPVVLGVALFATTPLPAAADSEHGYTVTMPYFSDDPDGTKSQNVGLQLVDAILVRPPAAIISTVSTALYMVTTPLTFVIDVDEQTADALVVWPWRLTVGRPLGYFGG
jgi:hypothetical protein